MSGRARAVLDEDHEPATRMCDGGCGRQLRVAPPPSWADRYGKPRAHSEARDPQTGARLFYCRGCTEGMTGCSA